MSTLHVKFGISPSLILDLHHDGIFELQNEVDLGQDGTWKEGLLTEWTCVVARIVRRELRDQRILVLSPSEDQELSFEVHDFFLRGDASISQKINNNRKASDTWKKRKTLFPF